MTNPPPGAAVPQDDTQRALDELERLIKDGNVNEDAWDYYRAQDMLATLRAALVPPADDEISAIRARHEAALARMADNNWPMSEGRQDVAALLEIVDKMRAEK